MVRHLEVEPAALIGMGARHLLVELDAEAGLAWRNDIALLPADRLLQYFRVKAAPGLDAFEDEEIGKRGGEVDIGGALDGTAIKVRRDLRIMGLGHGGDLLRLHDAADAAERHLQDRRGAALEDAGKFVFGGEAFASRERARANAREN